MASSRPWDIFIKKSKYPFEPQENTALFDEDDDDNDSTNTTSSSSYFPPLYQHKRSNSWHIQTTYSYSQNTRLYNSQSFSARDLLPHHMIEMVDEDEPDFTIDGYDQNLENRQLDEASNILEHLISQAKDQKEKSKIYRSAANANKRHFYNKEACQMYEEAEKADPESTQNYIDHAKLLDEIGQITEAERILQTGLEKTNIAESIITKLIKQFERRQKFDAVRSTLGKIYQTVGFQRSTAPSFAEGALFESRHGDVFAAISAFNDICQMIPAKTGYYVELAENIKRRGFEQQALQIAQKGVEKFPAMPNNWCQLIQLQKSTKDIIIAFQDAEKLISPLMMSKLEQSAAVMCAYFGDSKIARMILAECIVKAASDQRWRILYNAAMVELLYGDGSLTILLLPSAAHYTPDKFAPTVILAMAKVCEINDELEQAESHYETLTSNYSNDWRIFLEKAMFYVRCSKYQDALECTKKGLEMYPNTGRLWALRVQLEDPESKIKVLLNAIMSSPKSGEIWTEAARIVMNPLSPYFNLKSAKFFLNTAYLFTPQYIDLFIEMIRLEILLNGNMANLDKIREIFLGGDGNYGTVIFQFRKLGKEFTSHEFEAILRGVRMDIAKNHKLYQHAISRSDFVIESIRNEENRLRSDQKNRNPYMFAFGLSSFLEAMTNKADIETYKSVILGSSSVFM
ncbi:hypothetical protein M9Y10_001858 [Tritrichomonas musculus]|uniref:TPR Domain containing protein n=1 Tax=Tritrichomonas musculus TaxID=1915356 RepID=A0ABR2L863_9EUKA